MEGLEVFTTQSSNVVDDDDGFSTVEECLEKCVPDMEEWCENIIHYVIKPREYVFPRDHIKDVCEAAQRCKAIYSEPQDGYCPTMFDGFACVNSTMDEEIVNVSCPNFTQMGFDAKRYATRQCLNNSTWWPPGRGDYVSCVDTSSFEAHKITITIYIAGYSISLFFLLLAILIFFMFRRTLRCTRNEIHSHLFVASVLHNLSWLIWYGSIVYDYTNSPQYHPENEAGKIMCKFLHVLIHYFMVATYMWMLCEGLYLFIILIFTFVSEKRVKLSLYFIGWGLPLAVILVYVVCRASLAEPEDANTIDSCWAIDVSVNWIYKIPCIVSVCANLIFLLVIVFKLVSNFYTDMSDNAAVMRTFKAIALLAPLFGLHNLFSAFMPEEENSTERIVMERINAAAISFQGAVVAILFCLINNEVITEVKKFFGYHQPMTNGPQSMAMTQYTIVKHGGNGQQSPSSEEDIKNNTKTTNLNNTPVGDTKTESLEAVPLKV